MKAGQPKEDLTGKNFGMLTPIEYIKGGKWKCICECGKETIVDTRNLNSGHTTSCGCKVYSGEYKNYKDYTGYETEYIKVIKKIGSVGKPPHTRTAWLCLCKACGREFIKDSRHMTDGQSKTCGCVRSFHELEITKMLMENNIEFATQYTFPDLKGKKGRALRFDFAIFNKDHKLSHLIEFNGIQHYEEIKYTSWSSYAYRGLKDQQERDQKKIEYCNKHNIPLIIIPYYQKYTIKDLLLENEPVETIPSEIGSTTIIGT